MQQAGLAVARMEVLAQPTADLCDAHPDAQVLHGRYISYGGIRRCIGRVETISTCDDNSLVKAALGEPGEGRVLLVDNNGSLPRMAGPAL